MVAIEQPRVHYGRRGSTSSQDSHNCETRIQYSGPITPTCSDCLSQSEGEEGTAASIKRDPALLIARLENCKSKKLVGARKRRRARAAAVLSALVEGLEPEDPTAYVPTYKTALTRLMESPVNMMVWYHFINLSEEEQAQYLKGKRREGMRTKVITTSRDATAPAFKELVTDKASPEPEQESNKDDSSPRVPPINVDFCHLTLRQNVEKVSAMECFMRERAVHMVAAAAAEPDAGMSQALLAMAGFGQGEWEFRSGKPPGFYEKYDYYKRKNDVFCVLGIHVPSNSVGVQTDGEGAGGKCQCGERGVTPQGFVLRAAATTMESASCDDVDEFIAGGRKRVGRHPREGKPGVGGSKPNAAKQVVKCEVESTDDESSGESAEGSDTVSTSFEVLEADCGSGSSGDTGSDSFVLLSDLEADGNSDYNADEKKYKLEAGMNATS